MKKIVLATLLSVCAFCNFAFCQNMENGHQYVDLELPSGTMWATTNIGASVCEEYGSLFAWGETQPKSYFEIENYAHYTPASTYTDSDGFRYRKEAQWEDIGDEIAGTKYDAAHVNWGGKWVMPSNADLKELYANCSIESLEKNGVGGFKFTSKKNGRWIFLRWERNRPVWSSSKVKGTNCAYVLCSDWAPTDFVYKGMPIRPVCKNVASAPASSESMYATKAQFTGGRQELIKYLRATMSYPVVAQDDGIQGDVTVQFVVNIDGSITDVKVIKSVDPSLDKEACRVVAKMPKWTPATNKSGAPVVSTTSMTIPFRLQ